MLIRVKLFAVARNLAGVCELELQLSANATVAELRRSLVERVPALAPLLPYMQVAVDSNYARDDQQISPQAEVAVIPPVSGG